MIPTARTTIAHATPRRPWPAIPTARWVFDAFPSAAARWVAGRLLTPQRARADRALDGEPAVRPDVSSYPVTFGRDTLAAYAHGPGPPVLLVHDWEGGADDMAEMARALAGAGFRAVAFDLPAHGRSTGRRLTLAESARAIRRLADTLEPLAGLVGHSFGAAAMLLALRDGLDARCAVAVAPPCRFAPLVARVTRAWGIHARHDAAIRRALEARVGSLEQFDVDRVARAVDRPGLVLHDRLDRVVPFADGLAVADAWRGADCVTTEGLGHRELVTDPATIGRIVRFVLDRGARADDAHADAHARPSLGRRTIPPHDAAIVRVPRAAP